MSSRPPERHSGCPKPVIGIAGGIGSGKSVVSQVLRELGCGVIDSDRAGHEVLQEPEVQAKLREWWGDDAFDDSGRVSRRKIARLVFGRPKELQRLNALVHPRVKVRRDAAMAEFMADPDVVAIVWDTPLLFEAGLDRECDAIIFVKAPYDQRLERVQRTRGWGPADLDQREKSQIALDKKENLSDYSVDNSGDLTASRAQVRDVFSRIVSRFLAKNGAQDRPGGSSSA